MTRPVAFLPSPRSAWPRARVLFPAAWRMTLQTVQNESLELVYARRMLRAMATARAAPVMMLSAEEVHALGRGAAGLPWPLTVTETAARLLPALAAAPHVDGVTVRRIANGSARPLWEVKADPLPPAKAVRGPARVAPQARQATQRAGVVR